MTIALLRCDGGEEIDRFTSDDPRLLEFIGDRLAATRTSETLGRALSPRGCER